MIKMFSISKGCLRDYGALSTAELEKHSGVLLQTCNRIEFYAGEGEVPDEVARHLFRVTSGLESNLIGERAIQGQVKKSYIEASLKHRLDRNIHKLFQTALYVGKRVRSESGISTGAISHSQAAVNIICESQINLDKALITLIGAHKLNEDIICFLHSKGAETIFLGNRSFEKAQAVASKYGCEAFSLQNLNKILECTDVLISTTSAPHYIVKKEIFPANKEMIIIDLACPRDIDPQISTLEKVSLYDLETIEKKVNQNLDFRRCEIIKAERIINEELEKFNLKQKRDEKYIIYQSN